MKLSFQRVSDKGLDSSDELQSARFGSPGGSRFLLDSQSRPVVGLEGSFQDDMNSLAILAPED